MKIIELIILTAIMISLSGVPALGQGYQSYPSDGGQMSDSAFYTSNMPSNSETLVPLGQVQSSSGYGQAQSYSEYGQVQSSSGYGQYSGYGQATPVNALWIVDPSGMYSRTSLSIPLSDWAREDVLPGVSGYLTMYERYPSGIVNSLYLGYVNAGYRYMVWFRADLRGTHDVWYTVNGLESNHVTFNVYRTSVLTYTPLYVPYYYTSNYYSDYYYPDYYYSDYYYPDYYYSYPRPHPRPTPRPIPSPYSYVGTSTGARASS